MDSKLECLRKTFIMIIMICSKSTKTTKALRTTESSFLEALSWFSEDGRLCNHGSDRRRDLIYSMIRKNVDKFINIFLIYL